MTRRKKAKPMTALQILKAARKLLSKPERWTKSDLAADKNGYAVDPADKDAACWCALGAVIKQRPLCPAREKAERLLFEAMPQDYQRTGYLGQYNDTKGRTHKQILNWFDRAIERASVES